MRRLFIFAAYDRDGVIDDTLMYYLRALGRCGDVVFIMDNDASSTDVARVAKIPGVIHAAAVRHGEYDFGSYKRGYQWAQDNQVLDKYDWVYLVNDSVYLLNTPDDMIGRMESRDADMVGVSMYLCPPHIQSFFVGMRPAVFAASWFGDFMQSVVACADKLEIVKRYEIGLSNMVCAHGIAIDGLVISDQLLMYDAPAEIALRHRIPLLKKTIYSIGRRRWSHRRVARVVRRVVPKDVAADILANARRNKNTLSPDFRVKKYFDVRRVNWFCTTVRKVQHPEHRWLMLFGCIQIKKV